jgi:hypothetical protein
MDDLRVHTEYLNLTQLRASADILKLTRPEFSLSLEDWEKRTFWPSMMIGLQLLLIPHLQNSMISYLYTLK